MAQLLTEPGTGVSYLYATQTGPAAQMWSCLPMLETKILFVIFKVNGAKVPSPKQAFRGPADEHQLVQNYMQLPWPWLYGDPSWKESTCSSTVQQCMGSPCIMAKASTHSKTMVALVHTLTLLSMQHNVHVHIQHIVGVNNDIADALFHFEMDRFWQLCPTCRGKAFSNS